MLKAVHFNPSAVSKIMVRATNWLGDAVMSLPAIRAIRQVFPRAQIVLVARPWVADLYERETAIDRIIIYQGRGLGALRKFAEGLREEQFECAILLQNAFEAALMAKMAHVPVRIGYNRDARGWLLTRAIPVPEAGDIPRHERFYYLELLRRAGLIDGPQYARCGIPEIRLARGNESVASGVRRLAGLGITEEVIGISPGAAYGTAKRWLPERFAESASRICARLGCGALVFGSAAERELSEEVARGVRNSS